jgi:hypothetical protein
MAWNMRRSYQGRERIPTYQSDYENDNDEKTDMQGGRISPFPSCFIQGND